MKRIGSFFLVLLIIACSAAGMWVYQSWKKDHNISGEKEWKNVYIIKQKGSTLKFFGTDGAKSVTQEIRVKSDLREMEYEGVGDLVVRFEKVEKMVCKPEQLQQEVLAVGEDEIELANYGKIPVADGCNGFSMEDFSMVSIWDEIYVGQTDVRFVVADGKICAVLFMKKEPEVETSQVEENIRVILKTDQYAGYEHSEVKLRGTKKIYVKEGKEQKEIQPGEEVDFTPDSMKKSRVSITSEEGGKIEVMSLHRGGGQPLYRGKIEVAKAENGLYIINELPLEQYLYGVIPSEMPAEYEEEALKAQAVCARSYAVQHMKNNRLKAMGAHVDDSVSYQVYNNTAEDEKCNRAVDETKGLKAYCDGKLASTYFFSTSCGATTSSEDVGFTGTKVSYLTGKLQEKEFPDEDARERAKLVSDTFGEEDLFRKFLEEDRDILETKQPWYRWSTTISMENLSSHINAEIEKRSQTAESRIQVRKEDGTYVSEPINSIGTLKRIRIKKRGCGGVVKMVVLVGTEKTVRVYSEYDIRLLIFNENAIVRKNDGSNVSGMNMLPSGFFILNKSGNSYEIRGGGFGHGTGLSQTGANELAQAGRGYEEILKYYFDGVEVRGAENRVEK